MCFFYSSSRSRSVSFWLCGSSLVVSHCCWCLFVSLLSPNVLVVAILDKGLLVGLGSSGKPGQDAIVHIVQSNRKLVGIFTLLRIWNKAQSNLICGMHKHCKCFHPPKVVQVRLFLTNPKFSICNEFWGSCCIH
jgi:hypothetical protein